VGTSRSQKSEFRHARLCTLESADDHLRLGAISSLLATWWKRACFRAELRADLRDKPDFLRDIGIGLHEAEAEASRFFWEPLLLEHQ
jgi:uncharacterized protein YjiS (DUF1127 family)